MKKPLILIKPNNDAELNNQLFEINHSKINTVESNLVMNKLKSFLEEKGYSVLTIDKAKWEDAEQIIFFDLAYFDKYLKRLNKLKGKLKANLSLILIESYLVNQYQYLKRRHKIFDKVLTWKSDFVDNKKYFKYFLPEILLKKDIFMVPFNNKHFLCLINANKIALGEKELYSKRKDIAHFFEKTFEGIHIYGSGWNKKQLKFSLVGHMFFRWRFILNKILHLDFEPLIFLIQFALNTKPFKPNILMGLAKSSTIEVLCKYKFAICFENSLDTPGYITEKIFNCFNARCVPIYLGTEEIKKYIPDNCYINMRGFKDYQSLYDYLKSIDEKKYNEYIDNINQFLNSDKSYIFSNENFIKQVYGLITGYPNV